MRSSKLLGALVALAMLVAACTGGGSVDTTTTVAETTPSAERNELHVASSEPTTLDPHLVTDVGSHGFTGKLFAGLVHLDIALYDKDGNVLAANLEELTANQELIERFKNSELAKNLEDAIDENIKNGETSFELEDEGLRLVVFATPDLAENMPTFEDGTIVDNPDGTRTFTFTVRSDAKFSNGRPLTAWDVAYSLERTADPRTRSTTAELYLGDIVGVMDMQRDRIKNRVSPEQGEVSVDLPGIEVIDERTIALTTEADSVNPDVFLMKLTYPAAAVVDKLQAESPARWTNRPNSSGPYVIVKKDVAEIVMEANPNYHGHKPEIERVVFYLAGGSTYLRYQNGELDFTGVGITDLDLLEDVRDPSTEVSKQYFETVGMSTSYIGLNSNIPPFDDPLVRRAFALVINREAIAGSLLQDLAVPASGVLPPGMPGYRPSLKGQTYNPDKARELLSESKYAGNMPRIKLTTAGSGGSPGVVVEAIIESWRTELGVDVELEQIDYPTFLENMKKGVYQMYSLGWVADYPDPSNFIALKFASWLSPANNETQYANEEVDELILQARTETDPQKRIELFQKAEDIIIEDAPWIVLFHSKSSLLVKPYVCGYFPTPMGISILRYVSFCEDN